MDEVFVVLTALFLFVIVTYGFYKIENPENEDDKKKEGDR